MKILLDNAGKRFNREWVFRNASLEFRSGNSYAITGANGSGKSTFLQCIGGMLHINEGKLAYEYHNKSLPADSLYEYISFCAPYLDVIEEMSLMEFLKFHGSFKNYLPGFTIEQIVRSVQLEEAAHKQIRNYSSGMKQRVKLAQAFYSDSPILLLDEPCSNLDARGIELYHQLIEEHTKDRIVIVCSNDEVEYSFCQHIIPIAGIKPGI